MSSIIQAFFFLFSFCLFVYTESSVIKIRLGSSRDATFIPSWYSDMQVMQAAYVYCPRTSMRPGYGEIAILVSFFRAKGQSIEDSRVNELKRAALLCQLWT